MVSYVGDYHKCAKGRAKCKGLKGGSSIGYYACATKANCKKKPRKALSTIKRNIASRTISRNLNKGGLSAGVRAYVKKYPVRKKPAILAREKKEFGIIRRRNALRKKIESQVKKLKTINKKIKK